jgi:uncharacterized protein YneF (UPF0154 family)
MSLFVISVLNCETLNRITKDFLDYFNLVVTPLCLIVGLIIGYPLLRKKLVENYVSKQFEIMHEANRVLRKECLRIMTKYPDKYISEELNKQYIESCILDIEELSHLAFDSNPDAHRYSILLLKSLKELCQRYPEKPSHHYYKETLDSFINQHVKQIYNYAKSLRTTFDSNIKRKKRLTRKLDKLVYDNEYEEIDNVDYSINYYHASQLLVIFFENSLRTVQYNNPLLYLSCYLAVPTPSALARILYVRELYLPLALQCSEPIIFGLERKLYLIGFSARKSTKENGETQSYYVCYYANISDFGFVKGTIKNTESLASYQDSYLSGTEFQKNEFSNFKMIDDLEIIKVEIEADILHQEYIKNQKKFIRKLKSEVKK